MHSCLLTGSLGAALHDNTQTQQILLSITAKTGFILIQRKYTPEYQLLRANNRGIAIIFMFCLEASTGIWLAIVGERQLYFLDPGRQHVFSLLYRCDFPTWQFTLWHLNKIQFKQKYNLNKQRKTKIQDCLMRTFWIPCGGSHNGHWLWATGQEPWLLPFSLHRRVLRTNTHKELHGWVRIWTPRDLLSSFSIHVTRPPWVVTCMTS